MPRNIRPKSEALKDEGMQLLNQQMQQAISTQWDDIAPQIMQRDGTDKYGINVASDKELQGLIVDIYKSFITLLAQQVWTRYQAAMAPPSSIAAGVKSDRAHTIVTNYSKIAHSKLCHHFEPKFGTRIAKEKAFDLLGSVIGRSCSTFNKSMPAEYRRVGVRASVDNVITDTLSYSIE